LPEHDLAGVAHDDVQPEDGDGVDADAGQGLVDEHRQHQRQHREHDRDDEEDQPAHPGPAEEIGDLAHQTRTTTFLPNRPCGRRSRTTKRMMKGTAIFRSCPMNGTYTAPRFSRTPMPQAATTAPIGLFSPPMMTAASA